MSRPKPAVIRSILTLWCLALASCTSSPDEGDPFPGNHANPTSHVDLVSVTPPAGDSAGRFTARWTKVGCDEQGTPRVDTVVETTRYWIENGVLAMWNEGNCLALRLTGTSSALPGTWSLGTTRFDSVPARFRESPCWAASDYFFGIPHDEDEDGLLTNVSATYAFSESSATANMSLDFCYAYDYSRSFLTDPGSELLSSTCGTATIRNARGDTAFIRTGFRDNRVFMTFTVEGTTCRNSESFPLDPDAEICEGSENPAYWSCVTGTGFFGN